MNQQKTYNTVAELVETVTKAMEQDGITSEYIEQLSQTWKALVLASGGINHKQPKRISQFWIRRNSQCHSHSLLIC